MITAMICLVALTLFGSEPAQKAQPVEDVEKRHMRLISEFKAAVPDKDGRITLTVPIDFVWYHGKYTVIEERGVYSTAQRQKNEQLLDRVAIQIADSVADRIKKIVGTTNLETHFKGRTVTATGARSSVFYTGFPAQWVYNVTVDRIEDIEVLPLPVDAPKK